MELQLRILGTKYRQLVAQQVLIRARLLLDAVAIQQHRVKGHLVHIRDDPRWLHARDRVARTQLTDQRRHHVACLLTAMGNLPRLGGEADQIGDRVKDLVHRLGVLADFRG